MSKITYNDLWIKNVSELEEIAEDGTVDRSLRAIAYIKLKKIPQAQRLMSGVEETTAEVMEANLLLMFPMLKHKFSELVNKSNEILKLDPSMVGANLILAEYFRIGKQDKESLKHYLKVLDISPLNEQAFHSAMSILYKGKVVTDNNQALALIKKFRMDSFKSSIPSIQKLYYLVIIILWSTLIGTRTFWGILVSCAILWCSILNLIPAFLYILLLSIFICGILFSFPKRSVPSPIFIIMSIYVIGIWIFGVVIRWIIRLGS